MVSTEGRIIGLVVVAVAVAVAAYFLWQYVSCKKLCRGWYTLIFLVAMVIAGAAISALSYDHLEIVYLVVGSIILGLIIGSFVGDKSVAKFYIVWALISILAIIFFSACCKPRHRRY